MRRPSDHWTDSEMGRRRTWGSSGCLPTSIAAKLSEGERAVLSVIAYEFWSRHACSLSIAEISDQAGVGTRTTQRAIKWAAGENLLDVEDRGALALTKVILIRHSEWNKWMSAGRWHGPADFRRGGRV